MSVGIAGVVSIFGLGAAVVRYLAPVSQEEGAGWGAAKASLYLTVLLSTAASLFLVAAAPVLSGYFSKGTSLVGAFYLGAAWLFVSSIATPFQAMLQGMRRYATLAKVLLVSRFFAVAVAVIGLVITRSLAVAILSQVAYFGLVLLVTLPIVWRPLRGADPRPYYSKVMRYAYLLGIAGVVGTVAANADIVVVGGNLPLGSLAVYNAAIQISSFLSAFFVAPLTTALFAETSFSSESEEQVRTGTGLAVRFSLVTLLPASFFAAAMAPQLFDLFSGGGTYSQGIPYLQLITLFYAFTAIQAISVIVLQGVSGTKQVLVVGAITAFGEVALSLSLVPTYGLAGATYSRVAMFVLGCVLSLWFIRRYLPRPFDYGFLARALAASAIPALLVYVPSALVSNRIITIVPYTAIGVAVFVACAKLLRLLSSEDKAYLGHLLPGGLRWVLRVL